MCLGRIFKFDNITNNRLEYTGVNQCLEWVDPRREAATVVPEAEHVQANNGFAFAHLLNQVEAAQHPNGLWKRLGEITPLTLKDARRSECDQSATGPQQPVATGERLATNCVHN